MDLLLLNGHRQMPGYLPGSNLGMTILLQLARKRGYAADMLQDYVGNILRALDRMAEAVNDAFFFRPYVLLPGDADGDGNVTSTDARLALQLAVDKIK